MITVGRGQWTGGVHCIVHCVSVFRCEIRFADKHQIRLQIHMKPHAEAFLTLAPCSSLIKA